MAANCDVIVIFPIYDQFRASGNCIPVRESVKLTFPLRITLNLTKSENIKTELKNLQRSSHTITLSEGISFAKNADINKIKKALVIKIIFSETVYVCVLTYQISRLQSDSKNFQRRGQF